MAKILKRKYPAVYNREGKWFTGWEGDAISSPIPEDRKGDLYWEKRHGYVRSENHTSENLVLQYHGYSRGRSAANIELVDKEGFVYYMSMSGFDLLMRITDSPRSEQREKGWLSRPVDKYDIARETNLNGGGVWFRGTFCQTKQGQNYFIEPCEMA